MNWWHYRLWNPVYIYNNSDRIENNYWQFENKSITIEVKKVKNTNSSYPYIIIWLDKFQLHKILYWMYHNKWYDRNIPVYKLQYNIISEQNISTHENKINEKLSFKKPKMGWQEENMKREQDQNSLLQSFITKEWKS